MFLMQKYLKADGVIGIDGTRWQSEPLEFLSATASVATIQELRKVSSPSYLHSWYLTMNSIPFLPSTAGLQARWSGLPVSASSPHAPL